jgi:GntR family transcriptional repressor for pyruvate dehydrogenase complex
MIIEQIKGRVSGSTLKPGDKLPSEPTLALSFGVSRNQVREAIKKLEAFGIVTTIPQKGSYIAAMGEKTLDGLFSNVLLAGSVNYGSLIDTRSILEVRAVELAAANLKPSDIQDLERAHRQFSEKRAQGQPGFDEDMYFHLKIAEFSGSPVLNVLIALLIKDILPLIKNFSPTEEPFGTEKDNAMREHRAILDALIAKNRQSAIAEMRNHLNRPQLVEWARLQDAG